MDEKWRRSLRNDRRGKVKRESGISYHKSKKIYVKHPVYVRVKIEFSGEDKQGKFQAGEYVSFQDPTGEWVKHGEWYYHSKALEQDQVTGNLFEETDI